MLNPPILRYNTSENTRRSCTVFNLLITGRQAAKVSEVMSSELTPVVPSEPVSGTLMNEVSYSGLMGVQAVAGDYLPILIFLIIATGMSLVMAVLPMLLLKQKPDTEKLSAYECGFESYGDARSKFDVRFYLVAILFIIFDLEVAFLFPWAVSLGGLGVFGFWSMMIFLGVLTVGFIYEWKKGALEWE